MKFSISTKISMPRPKMPKKPSIGMPKVPKVAGMINPLKVTR